MKGVHQFPSSYHEIIECTFQHCSEVDISTNLIEKCMSETILAYNEQKILIYGSLPLFALDSSRVTLT